jgi:hypothetical protein
MIKSETFKDCVGYEGLYSVSNFGRVLNQKTNALINQYIDRYGYKYVSLSKGKKEKVHRLVAKAFISNPENKPTVNHKDEIKENNHVDNLEWFTVSQQNKYSRGIDIKIFHNGEIKTFPSVSDASDVLNLDFETVVNMNLEYNKLMSMCKNILISNNFSYRSKKIVSSESDCIGINYKNSKYEFRLTIAKCNRICRGGYKTFKDVIYARNSFIIENGLNYEIYLLDNDNINLIEEVFDGLYLLLEFQETRMTYDILKSCIDKLKLIQNKQ